MENKLLLEKLPKWAQEHIKHLEMERSTALDALNDSVNRQKPSKIYYTDVLSLGEQTGPSFKRFYIQSNQITVESAGVELTIYASNGDSQRYPGISLQWSRAQRMSGVIAAIPKSFQSMELVTKENMR